MRIKEKYELRLIRREWVYTDVDDATYVKEYEDTLCSVTSEHPDLFSTDKELFCWLIRKMREKLEL